MTRLLFALAALALVGCSSRPAAKHDDAPTVRPPTEGPKVVITGDQGELVVSVEVVSTPATIERGLMWREYLAPDAGMLFLMPGEERDWSFWMRNTLIPLDMIFITGSMTIAGIVENAEPRTETERKAGAPSRYVLEVNGGWSATHHVKPGARVRFVGVPQ